MAFTKSTIFDAVTIRSTGHVEIRMAKLVLEDGEEIARNYDRRVISPTDDITNEPTKIKQICTFARSAT